MRRLRYLPLLLAGLPLFAPARSLQEGDIDWGAKAVDFPKAFAEWRKGEKWSDDDNFFISRVRPKTRFRNRATQIDTTLDESNDKKLIYWVPINKRATNALPDGVFDSEVFPMWAYVTHYGNWTAPLARIPGAFSDAAHKNGVAVSAVASVPYGRITDEWREALELLSKEDPEKLADFLLYYGIDGIGYNSEFIGPADMVCDLGKLHENTIWRMKEAGNPLAEFIWYDGTNVSGEIMFDWGLSLHNAPLWGTSKRPRSALFFNYNWNYDDLLENSVLNAGIYGRTPLDLYCSINMQGREPHNDSPEIWPLLAKYPLSIGLWGAHEESMFFESRAEQGPLPDQRQETYLKRVENWFSGGNRNPASRPAVGNAITYGAENPDFMGMAEMMSARSPLKWDLSEEPFITYFNLGNGKFLNFMGERANDREWYNIGVQDYLPTWMWWWADKFLGRNPSDVPERGLEAGFVWDDAWTGGSTVRIAGSSPDEYLHLFKTEFELRKGDEITFRYKLNEGDADAWLALSLKGNEETPIEEESLRLMEKGDARHGEWIEKKFKVGKDLRLPKGAEVAMIALHFADADSLDMRLGELSIVREKEMGRKNKSIPTPIIERNELLAANESGVTGKIIFNMPNDKEPGEVCYNSDVNTSMFKLYTQEEGREPQLAGLTTSWAGMYYDIPLSSGKDSKLRLGVSALSLDHSTESDIAWGEYYPIRRHFVETPAREWMKDSPQVVSRLVKLQDGYPQSQGVKIGKGAFGFNPKEAGLSPDSSFSINFIFKPETFDNQAVEMLNIRSRRDPWAKNQWGWFWHTLDKEGGTAAFSMRLKNGETVSYQFEGDRLFERYPNMLTYVFEINDEGKIRPGFYLNGKKLEVKSWSVNDSVQTEVPGFVGPVDIWNEGEMVGIGGYLHRSGSAVGTVDNVSLFAGALTDEEVESLFKGKGIPKDLTSVVGYFDFEEAPDSDGFFVSKGANPFKAGVHGYRDTEVEGQGALVWRTPETAPMRKN